MFLNIIIKTKSYKYSLFNQLNKVIVMYLALKNIQLIIAN